MKICVKNLLNDTEPASSKILELDQLSKFWKFGGDSGSSSGYEEVGCRDEDFHFESRQSQIQGQNSGSVSKRQKELLRIVWLKLGARRHNWPRNCNNTTEDLCSERSALLQQGRRCKSPAKISERLVVQVFETFF